MKCGEFPGCDQIPEARFSGIGESLVGCAS